MRVLMADPDETLPPVYRRHLAQEGFELVAATSGLECVASLREQAPDLLVLEPELPWGGGDGVLAIMGETPELAAVPVMVHTSCCDPHVLCRISRYPISGFHLKPLTPVRLAGRIRALLEHPRQQCSLAEQTGRLKSSICRRTGGLVRNLHVEIAEGRVIVRGRSDSDFIKHLALTAVREAFEASATRSERIEMDIQVD
ncbi:MAG: hypothetical protein SFU86_17825 [Pirellulaceae bacterium]|nr:hypothetical protein [Pirellulaceae bacterium]